jgi:hypothetical protein
MRLSLFLLLLMTTLAACGDPEPEAPETAPEPAPEAASADTQCYELRTYHTHEGKLDALLTRFRDHTTRIFENNGFTNVGYWVPTEQDNTLIYIVSFPSCEARDSSWAAFRDDPAWQKAYADSRVDGALVERVESVLMDATDYSPAVGPGSTAAPRTFELRTYYTNDGKLDDLHARFRDHTMGLFERHGLTNVGYWVPRDQDSTLTYLLAADSRAAADTAWNDFRNDPDWVAAKTASEVDGPLVARVVSIFMTPTDYSTIQ